MLQTGSLFLLYLEERAEFSLISIGTRRIPKHTSVARKKLPNKEPDSHNTDHEALLSFTSELFADQALQAANLRAFLAALSRIIRSHSAQRNNWGFSMLLMKSYLFSRMPFEPLRSYQEWNWRSSEVCCSSCCTKDLLHQAEKILIYLKKQNALSHTDVGDSWKLPRKTLKCNSAVLSYGTLARLVLN